MGWDMILRAVLSLMLVLGLIAGAGLLARRLGVAGGLTLKRGGRRRLGVVETLQIDNRRRLVLVRKDDSEYLLLIGGGADLHLDKNSAPEAFTLPEGPAP